MTVKANEKLQAIFDAAIRAEEKAESLFRQTSPQTTSLDSARSFHEEELSSARPPMSEAFLNKLRQGPLRSRQPQA